MRKLILAFVALALFVPSVGNAGTTTYRPGQYADGPRGGDMYNYFSADKATGAMTVVRYHPVPVNGGLGCGGQGGYANFEVTHAATDVVKSVTVSYADGLVDPYTFFNIGIRKGANYVQSSVVRGPILGNGSVKVALPDGTTGPIVVWFGIQVASACPNVDGGSATFTSVAVES